MYQKNCVIIHGCPGNKEKSLDPATRTYDKHWLPWARQELELKGVKTAMPLMPEPWAPNYEKWKEVFNKEKVDENTILIGTSCGCIFLLRWLGETKQKVKKLILVAPWLSGEDVRGEIKAFQSFTVDPGIKGRVDEIIMFTSDNEDERGKGALKKFHNILGGKVIELKGYGHYIMKHMGTEKFPELIKAVLK